MFAFITIGTNNLSKSSKFYDEILDILDISKVVINENYIGYGKKYNKDLIRQGKSELIEFYLMKPYNKKNATNGNGTMIVFNAKTNKQVDNFYKTALKIGGIDEGFPGPRHDEHYYAYVRDLDGNKICAFSKN